MPGCVIIVVASKYVVHYWGPKKAQNPEKKRRLLALGFLSQIH